jgi:hypothetical protein
MPSRAAVEEAPDATRSSHQVRQQAPRIQPHSAIEPISRRLPCFLIATVDKFAAMPLPPDLVIQDELHRVG